MHKFLPILIIAGLLLAFFSFNPMKLPFSPTSSPKPTLQADNRSCVSNKDLAEATGAYDPTSTLAFFNNKQVAFPKNYLANLNNDKTLTNVLGAVNSNGEEKWIEVSLNEQKLRAWEGNHIAREFLISSGLWFPTVRGTFSIYSKFRYIRMTGGNSSIGTYYDLPNVPDTMFFYQGYAVHGAYWHHNFGHPMSHGCVNEPLDEAHWLFEWAGPRINPDQNSVRATADNPGSRVFIH